MNNASQDDLALVLEKLTAECKRIGVPLADALAEKSDELVVRTFLRCIPDRGLKESQWPAFLRDVLRVEPTPALLEQIRCEARETVLDPDEYVELERRQGCRCALCGAVLRAAVKPHIDHIVPVALGGKNDKSNVQLLCQQCNLGKSKLLGWIMGAPFLDEGITGRLRYCVLTRCNARCCAPGCSESARTAELVVLPRVPVSRGGRLIFDNLHVMCRTHGDDQVRKWKDEAYTRFRGLASLAWDRGRKAGTATGRMRAANDSS
jgi:5-methylcytosine-specific restriction endonuclease McrA